MKWLSPRPQFIEYRYMYYITVYFDDTRRNEIRNEHISTSWPYTLDVFLF